MNAVKKALLSCFDKTGLVEFAKALHESGVELIASGGTAKKLIDNGLPVTTVENFAGMQEGLDGRVKTLHPAIHGAILAVRDNADHMKSIAATGGIDLVVVNLYPFEDTIAAPGVTQAEAIEQIDIGGVALLRGAAKNFAYVGVVSSPGQYASVLQSLRENQGALTDSLRKELAVAAFKLTHHYDGAIGNYLAGAAAETEAPAKEPLPAKQSIALTQHQALRYGENPHQKGAWYAREDESSWGLSTLSQKQGKELSYNNLLDMDAALRSLLDLDEPAAVVVKHASMCGLAVAPDCAQAYTQAFACDAESAFGGIVGVNRAIDKVLAEQLVQTFLEVVIAPEVSPEALSILSQKKNLRVVTLRWPEGLPAGIEWRPLSGAWLAQERDILQGKDVDLKVVTQTKANEKLLRDLLFAWHAVKHVKSNGIVLAKDGITVGIGQGQPSRVGSVCIALEKAGEKSRGAVAASDAFFPFPDSIEKFKSAGIAAIIQPGGSIKDQDVVAAADKAGLPMVFTGARHFRH